MTKQMAESLIDLDLERDKIETWKGIMNKYNKRKTHTGFENRFKRLNYNIGINR